MTINLSSNFDMNDEDLLRLEKVNNWAAKFAGRRMSIDQFAKDLKEKINEAGFTCEVKVYDTNQAEVYAFEVELNGRTYGAFDPDKMVWEVTNNILELPGQDKGFIPTKDAAAKLLNHDFGKGQKHKH